MRCVIWPKGRFGQDCIFKPKFYVSWFYKVVIINASYMEFWKAVIFPKLHTFLLSTVWQSSRLFCVWRLGMNSPCAEGFIWAHGEQGQSVEKSVMAKSQAYRDYTECACPASLCPKQTVIKYVLMTKERELACAQRPKGRRAETSTAESTS